MSHPDEVIVRVDVMIEEGVITYMNELLIALSDDAESSWEDRYIRQQRLHIIIAHHGRKHKEDTEARHEQLTKGGAILWLRWASSYQPGTNYKQDCVTNWAGQRPQQYTMTAEDIQHQTVS